MKKGPVGRGSSNLPVPKMSKGSPSASVSHLGKGRGNIAKSAEDLPRQVNLSTGASQTAVQRRAISPGNDMRKGLSPVRASAQSGVRYIAEDMIKKAAKEDNFDLITTLNLTLTKEGGKKIKYIENLDKCRKVHTLCLSNNMIEKMEKLDKLLRLRDLNLSHNAIVKIEGIENMVFLQTLNLSWNKIEHIPPWMSKKLKALRNINLSHNKLASLNELSKLKALPDLTQLDVSHNPLSELPHSRLFIIFHLRTVSSLDSVTVTGEERAHAQQRFAQGELERLEKQLEQEEGKNRRLEETHNKSLQEKSQQEATTRDLKVKDKELKDQLSRMQRELDAKNDLLKKKTVELNKACEKHYQLEQELAFYKIDSKFDSLGEVPHPEGHEDDDSLMQGESPYIGRARYKANQHSREHSIVTTPQKIQVHSLVSSPSTPVQPPHVAQMHRALDTQILDKQREIQQAEERLQGLTSDLNAAEDKLVRATNELKKMAERKTPEPFRDDNKYKIRQRLAKKMKTVNEMRDSATQMEEEIDRRQQMVQENKGKVSRLKEQVAHMRSDDPNLPRKKAEMVDKEQQISEDNQTYNDLQNQLQDMLQTIAKETTDIKKLEQQLNEERIEANEELRAELDDVVDGLQSYLQTVKDQSARQKEEFEDVVKDKESLEERVRRMESELKVLDKQAEGANTWQRRVTDIEGQLKKSQDLNKSLSDQLHQSRQLDPQLQDRLEHAETEARNLRRTLNDMEKRSQTEKRNLQKQIESERERVERMARQQKDGGRAMDELRKMESQLDAARNLNTSLREQLDDVRKQQQQASKDTFRPSDLKKRLKDLTHNFRTGKGPVPPKGEDDILGRTFNDLHHYVQDKMNKSNREVEEAKKASNRLSVEVQTLKENLKQAEKSLAKREEKKDMEKKKVDKSEEADISILEDEIRRLKQALQDAENRAKQGIPRTRIVYAPGSDSDDRASSLNSEEKALFDELQRELMELRRNMRNQEDDNERRAVDAETELALLTEEMQQREKEFQAELDKQRHEAELLREKQEARIQVIAEDLEQAQQAADHLQGLLETRETQMQDDMQEADISNQVLSAQEEELARLYDILEAQKEEIENLNQMLDHLAQQGPDGVGPGFDDELWRIRQEVNSLKETLAMQSAYVQTMPAGAAAAGVGTSTHTGGGPPGVGAAPPHRQTLAGSQAAVYSHHSNTAASLPHQSATTVPRPASSPPRAPLAQSSPPGRSSAPILHSSPGHAPQMSHPQHPSGMNRGGQFTGQGAGPNQAGHPGHGHPGQTPVSQGSSGHPPLHHSSPQHSQAASAQGSVPPHDGSSVPIVGGNLGAHLTSPPRIHMIEHIGTERRESKAPSGGRYGSHRQGETTPGQHTNPDRPGEMADEVDGMSQRSGRSASRNFRSRAQSRRKSLQPSAFEPVYRPQPHHPNQSPPPPGNRADPSYQGVPVYPGGQGVPTGTQGSPTGFPGPGHMLGGHGVPLPAPEHFVNSTYAPYDPSYSSPTPGFAPAASQTDPRVAFNPVDMEYSYPAGYPEDPAAGGLPAGYSVGYPEISAGGGFPTAGYPGGYPENPAGGGVQPAGHPAGYPAGFVPPLPGQYNLGQQVYIPSGPAQAVPYNSGRFYYSAGSKNPVRIYYPANGRIPMTLSGPPPPPPPPGMHNVGVISPGPRPGSMPVTPIATGTPILDSRISTDNFDGSYITAPSPIRAAAMGSPLPQPRGILKNGGVPVEDDSYLFCNVPEHHDLEDYIAELQEKLKKLKIRVSHYEEINEEIVMDEEKRLINRLKSELEDRRDELEGLDLAIERQKKNLRKLKVEEKGLRENKVSAKEELDFLRTRSLKNLVRRKRKYEEEESFDESSYLSRQKYLKDEIECLEKTLAKRKGQLRDADRLLRECNADLKDAREQARDTVKKYDSASVNLQTTALEAKELEKRATDAGIQLVKTQDQLTVLRSEVKSIERKRDKQEKLLRDVIQVIAKKDSEFKDIDSRLKTASKSLQRVNSDLTTAQMKEKETVDALRDSDDVLSKRRLELSRLRDQLESTRAELEKLDQAMGKKKTEMKLMSDSMDRRQTELNSVLREAETEISNRQRDLRDQKEQCKSTEQQKHDLLSLVKAKRVELDRVKAEVEQEDEVLQRLVASVNKHKTELKHVYEMQQYEQTELENLKAQHNQKIAELEKTQRSLIEEKAELEQLNTETSRKSSEVERLRQSLDRERQEVDHLTMEKQSLEDRINTLVRERDMLNENCKTLDDKLNQMKRNHRIMDEKIESTSDRLERLESELRQREREMDDANHQKSLMQKDISSLKQNIKESRTELQTIEENIQESEEHMRSLEQSLREAHSQRDEAKIEIERLNEAIRTTRYAHEEASRQEKVKQGELQDLLTRFNHHDNEFQSARQNLNKVKMEAESEEGRLNRLVSNANLELETLRSQLTSKQQQLDAVTQELEALKDEADQIGVSEEKFEDMEKKIKVLEKEVGERNDEKQELAKALTMSYEELQKLRQEANEEQERLTNERADLQSTLHEVQNHLETTKQEMTLMQSRSSGQVSELQAIAEEHFNRANRLNDELTRLKREVVNTKKQTDNQSEDKENRPSRRDTSFREGWRKEALKEKLVEEQDYLRYQLRQQMLRHAQTMESTRLQSEGTIESLKRKLNTLQEVLFNNNNQMNSDIQAIHEMTRSRSNSPPRSPIYPRNRSQSPLNRCSHSYLAGRRIGSRSRSNERLRQMVPERDLM